MEVSGPTRASIFLLTTWQSFKNAFRRRYEGVHTDQYNFMKLQTARQKKGESPQEFADRCRGLAQKILCKTDEPVEQRIHQENAERMLLASFVSGLYGTPGTQIRYGNIQSLSEALRIATAFQEAENKSGSMRVFTQNLTNLYVYCRDLPAENAQEVEASSIQLTCVRSLTHVVSEIGLQIMPTGLRPHTLGTRRLRLRYVVTNAKE